jgi:hypothetical protein
MKPCSFSSLVSVVLFVALATTAGAACDAEDLPVDDLAQAVATPAPGHAAGHNCAAANAEGKSCDDGLFCTVDDTCHSGVCVGTERPCANVVGFCDVATCDEAHDTCVATPRPGGACVDRCDTTKLKKFYRKGWQKGFEAVSKAWDRRHGNCDRTEAFVDRISAGLEDALAAQDSEATQKAHRRCRKAGAVDGAFAALDVIQSFCDQTCFLDGDFTGKLAAESYCEMAIGADGPLDVVDWLRGPLNMCGLNYEIACDSSFVGTSVDYSSSSGSCAPLTEGAYEAAWDASRLVSCDYRNHDAAP